jgi:FixJ family two-component response regulator
MTVPLAHIVDDDDAVLESLLVLLDAWDVPATGYPSGEAFLAALTPQTQGCVVTDIKMPRLGGLELLAAMRARGCDLPVIVISATVERAYVDKAIALGAEAMLLKPFAPSALVDRVRSAIAAR